MTKVLIFGSFDVLHDGHRAFLREAKALGDYLVVVVAPDSVIKDLKGHSPRCASAERIAALKNERIADEVVLGDAESNSWKILKKYKPDIIALGYDQEELKAALEEYFENLEKHPTIVVLTAFQPEKYKSSLLNP